MNTNKFDAPSPEDTFAVTVGEGVDAFTIYYDDYGNALECALAYKQDGMKVSVELLD